MANINSDIITTIDASNPPIADKFNYLGPVTRIPFFIDASVSVPNDTDVITITKALPPKTRAVCLMLNHDGTNGVAASTTLAVKAGTTVLTPEATIPTSADTSSTFLTYCLKNTDVSGKKITLTVGGADWSDTVDMYGILMLVSE